MSRIVLSNRPIGTAWTGFFCKKWNGTVGAKEIRDFRGDYSPSTSSTLVAVSTRSPKVDNGGFVGGIKASKGVRSELTEFKLNLPPYERAVASLLTLLK